MAPFGLPGPDATRARAIANTPADVLRKYNNGEWPHKASFDRGELADNGNFIEPDAIAVRHGICGDPEQVGGHRLPGRWLSPDRVVTSLVKVL